MSPHIKAAVLNAGGAPWIDVFANSSAEAIRCPLVDALIEAGVLEGELWDGSNGDALCRTNEWRFEPAYRRVSHVARWLLDPADPGNFAARAGASQDRVTVLVQEIEGETLVPNSATSELAYLMGLTQPVPSVPAISNEDLNPAPAVCDAVNARENLWVEYRSGSAEPTNEYLHQSIGMMGPVNDARGRGARRVQSDAIGFLAESLERVPSSCSFVSSRCSNP